MNNEDKQRLAGFFKVLLDVDRRYERWNARLEHEPDGFPVEGSWQCRECTVQTELGWYTGHGVLCPECKKKLLYD